MSPRGDIVKWIVTWKMKHSKLCGYGTPLTQRNVSLCIA